MNWKKIFAKEIIILFSILILSIIIFGIVELKNHYAQRESEILKNSVLVNNRKIDSLNKRILSKARKEQLILNLTKKFEQGTSDEDGRLYSRDFKIKFGEKRIFKQIDSISKIQNQIKSEQKQNYNSYIPNGINGFTQKSIMVLLIAFYPIRISFLLIRWAIRILKQK